MQTNKSPSQNTTWQKTRLLHQIHKTELSFFLFIVHIFLTPLFSDAKLERLQWLVLGSELVITFLSWSLEQIWQKRFYVARSFLDG